MPQGKHKGARVLLTLDKDAYARWQAYAAAMGMPTATLLRELLEIAEQPMAELVGNLERLKQPGANVDEILGPILLRALRTLDELP